MIPIPGTILPRSPLATTRWVQDVIYFDGPLVSEFRTQFNEPLLFSWCDADEASNRWLAFRVLERDLIRFTVRKADLFSLVKNPADGFLYLVDIDESLRHRACSVVDVASLPADYTPDAGTLLPQSTSGPSHSTYAALLNGSWGTHEISEFAGEFQKACLALYAYGNSEKHAAHRVKHNHPWKGGYSAVHFYQQLYIHTPVSARPEVKAFVYASPGYTKWHLDPSVASSIRTAVAAFSRNSATIQFCVNDAYKVIREYRLNALHAETPPTGSEMDRYLGYFFDRIVESLGSIDGEHLRAVHGGSNFVCLKIVLSISKRLKFLSDLAAKGMIEY